MSSNDPANLEDLISIAEFLIRRCTDTNTVQSCVNTPLVEAIRSDPNEAESDRGCTPLPQALHAKNRDCAQLLIKYGADVNLEDEKGRLPLAMAIEHEDIDLVKLLLDAGAECSVQNAFLDAVKRGNLDIVALLIARGAKVNVVSGKTPLSCALEVGDPRILQLLIDAGADVNLPDATGDTPLTHAIKQAKMEDSGERRASRMEDLSFLIYYFDLEMDYFDEFESSGSSRASGGMDFELVRLLLDNGADVNLLNCLRQSPFSLAVARKNLALAKYLQQRGATVDCVPEIRQLAKEDEIWMDHFERFLNQE